MKLYRKTELVPMEPWTPETDMTGVSVSDADRAKGSPKEGDMIAHGKPGDRWLIEASTHAATYEPAD